MGKPLFFTKVQQKEQRQLKKKLEKGEITGDEFADYLEKSLEIGRKNYKNYLKRG